MLSLLLGHAKCSISAYVNNNYKFPRKLDNDEKNLPSWVGALVYAAEINYADKARTVKKFNMKELYDKILDANDYCYDNRDKCTDVPPECITNDRYSLTVNMEQNVGAKCPLALLKHMDYAFSTDGDKGAFKLRDYKKVDIAVGTGEGDVGNVINSFKQVAGAINDNLLLWTKHDYTPIMANAENFPDGGRSYINYKYDYGNDVGNANLLHEVMVEKDNYNNNGIYCYVDRYFPMCSGKGDKSLAICYAEYDTNNDEYFVNAPDLSTKPYSEYEIDGRETSDDVWNSLSCPMIQDCKDYFHATYNEGLKAKCAAAIKAGIEAEKNYEDYDGIEEDNTACWGYRSERVFSMECHGAWAGVNAGGTNNDVPRGEFGLITSFTGVSSELFFDLLNSKFVPKAGSTVEGEVDTYVGTGWHPQTIWYGKPYDDDATALLDFVEPVDGPWPDWFNMFQDVYTMEWKWDSEMQSQNEQPSTSEPSGSNVGAIVGGVIAGIVVIAAVIIVVILIKKGVICSDKVEGNGNDNNEEKKGTKDTDDKTVQV